MGMIKAGVRSDCQMVIGSFTTKKDTSVPGALHCARREDNGNGFYYPFSIDAAYWIFFISCCHQKTLRMPFLSLNLQISMFQSQRKDCITTVEWDLSDQHMGALQ